MNIYVASSWRNRFQPGVIERLRAEGHTCYDFRNPNGAGENTGFGWQQIDPNWQTWTLAQYKQALTHATAQKGFESDERGMIRADACVLVMPSGRSAHIEFGWMLGRGQLGYVLLSEEGFDPDLMYLLTPYSRICTSLDELVGAIAWDESVRATKTLGLDAESGTLTFRSSSAKPNMTPVERTRPFNERVFYSPVRNAVGRGVGLGKGSPEGVSAEEWEKQVTALLADVKESGANPPYPVLFGVDSMSGSPASPPIMPHVTTSPAGEVEIAGGECNLPVPGKPLLVYVTLPKDGTWGAAAYAVTDDREYAASGMIEPLLERLRADGYVEIDPALRVELDCLQRIDSHAQVFVHEARFKAAEAYGNQARMQADAALAAVQQYLP